ncbi:alpha/beta fold hydrolase [Rhodococcus sp. NPDC003318]|uniref:alpha/beta fold hydrolase n=1 Tax=Rhodococcus sp. NPDC003318 TaxID=3364503 RepID=UPI00368AC1B9
MSHAEIASTVTTASTTSADGTEIGWRRLGTGPAIVMVHGSIATGEQWLPVATALADRYTCHLVDRRGRGLSGDAEAYELDTEVADIAAVVDALGPGTTLLGHSYGAICVAAAVAAGVDVAATILYEPPLPVAGPVGGSALPRFTDAVRGGEYDRALTIAMTDVMTMPPAGVDALRRTPVWAEMVALSPTWVRELAVIDGLEGDLDRFHSIASRTLFLLGANTAPHHKEATAYLQRHLADTTVVEFPGQEHFAHVTGPRAVASAIDDFLARA